MIQPKRPNLFWLFVLICIGYFPTFGMYYTNNPLIDRAYGLDELREEFVTILERQPEFIYLDSAESQYNATNGMYKLFPYYQKISTEQLTSEDSRFIIHKHVMTGQWQLTEVYDYFWTRNIKAFPVTEKNEQNAMLNNQFINLQKMHELKTRIFDLKMEVKSKNETIKSLKNKNEELISVTSERRKESKKQLSMQKELESKLVEQEKQIYDIYKTQNKLKSKLNEKKNEIRDIYNNQEELKLKLIEKENEIFNFNKTQNELKSKLIEKENEIRDIYNIHEELKLKLIEKENEICDIYNTRKELKSKLIDKENQIRDLESKIQKYKKLKSEKNEIHQETIKLIHIENRSKILNLKNKHLEEIEKKSKQDSKLLEKEKQLCNQELSKFQKLNEKLKFENKEIKSHEKLLDKKIEILYVTNHALENNLKETKDNLKKHELQPKEEILEIKPNSHQNIETKKMKKTEKVEIVNSKIEIENKSTNGNHHKLNGESLKLDFEIDTAILLNLEQSNTQNKATNNNHESNETLELDFKIETNVLLNLVHSNTIKMKKQENFESKIKFEEFKTQKLDTPLPTKQKRKNNKVKSQSNFQSSGDKIEKKDESIETKEHKNKKILENKTILQEHNAETKLLENTPKKHHTGLIRLLAKVVEQDKQKENLLQLSEKLFKSKDHKNKEILHNVNEIKILKSMLMGDKLKTRIEQILHGSRPSNLNFLKTNFNEAHDVIMMQIAEHKVFVDGACKRLHDLNDDKLTSKIALFLEDNRHNNEETKILAKGVQTNIDNQNKNALTTDKVNYHYELIFMHHGASFSLEEKLNCWISRKWSTKFADNYGHTVTKVYEKHAKMLLDTLLVVDDKKTRIKFKCFQDKPGLYYEAQYTYEMMLMVIGLIYGAGDILNELVNQIITFKDE